MKDFRELDYNVFNMFDKQWAIVTAGTTEHFNSCTVSWGSLGNIWGSAGKSIPIVTVYVHPARYTSEFLTDSDIFTVSFSQKRIVKRLDILVHIQDEMVIKLRNRGLYLLQ